MKQEETKPSLLREVRQRMAGGIRSRLDALSPTERLYVVFGMLAVMAVLLLFRPADCDNEEGLFTNKRERKWRKKK